MEVKKIIEEELLIYIDGKYYPKSKAKISVFDHGLLYGDGVFEGIRAYDGVVFRLGEHIDRLYRSAHTIDLQIPMTKMQMIHAVLTTLKKNNTKEAYIRLVVTRGVGDLGLDPRKCEKPTVIIIIGKIKLVEGEVRQKGITTIIASVRRNPVDTASHEVKSLNYLNSVLARTEANYAGVNEAICLNKDGFVCEGVGENIFIVKDETLITPPSCTGALDGITKRRVMKLAEVLGYNAKEGNITPNELLNADEAFFTGTAAEIMPIREVNHRTIGNGKLGSITKRLMEEFEKIVRDPQEGIPIYPTKE